jgi:hypothetical protein
LVPLINKPIGWFLVAAAGAVTLPRLTAGDFADKY